MMFMAVGFEGGGGGWFVAPGASVVADENEEEEEEEEEGGGDAAWKINSVGLMFDGGGDGAARVFNWSEKEVCARLRSAICSMSSVCRRSSSSSPSEELLLLLATVAAAGCSP